MPEPTISKDIDVSEYAELTSEEAFSTQQMDLVKRLSEEVVAYTDASYSVHRSLEKLMAELLSHISTATDPEVHRSLEETYQRIQKLYEMVAPRTDDMARLLEEVFARVTLENSQKTATLNILTDSSVDPKVLAEFLAELSSLYSDISDGDELIIDHAEEVAV